MADTQRAQELTREVKSQLDGIVVGIELTLISIIQGLALGVLASNAVTPIIELRFEYWPYIVVGLIAILIFWSRALIHTLSFIGWPLEFGHNFIYFGSTLIEATALTQITNPANWFALNAVSFAASWFLYWYDLRIVYRHAGDFRTSSERSLLHDIIADQLVNIRFLMPAGVMFGIVAWWAIRTWPEQMIDHRWHIGLAVYSILVATWYLWDGMRILRRRSGWIVARYLQERREAFEPEDLEVA